MMRLEQVIWNSNTCRTMKPSAGRILTVLLVTALGLRMSYAQPKSAGISFSFAGIGAVYEYTINHDTFASFEARAETAQVFSGFSQSSLPGISASFTWNMIFARIISRNHNEVRFHAGPGVAVGLTEDIALPKGLFCGLKGRIGGECTFDRKIAISLSLSTVIGAHLSKEREMVEMNIYHNGLLNSIFPEVAIKYAF